MKDTGSPHHEGRLDGQSVGSPYPMNAPMISLSQSVPSFLIFASGRYQSNLVVTQSDLLIQEEFKARNVPRMFLVYMYRTRVYMWTLNSDVHVDNESWCTCGYCTPVL